VTHDETQLAREVTEMRARLIELTAKERLRGGEDAMVATVRALNEVHREWPAVAELVARYGATEVCS
jgi:hypothetical protein